jgi:ectoine hydroxylase-related dioxygenase (phytanoyl-CoA dioxygenase family)
VSQSDLSVYSRPITDLFPRLGVGCEWERFRLSDDEVEFFRAHGYLSGVQMLDETQLRALRSELSALVDPSHPGNSLFYEYHSNESRNPSTVLFHALGAWRVEPGFHDLLWHPAFTVPAAQLLGGAVRFWHDQLFCKPARSGGVVAWHQDYSYWTRTRPLAHLTCWIGLDDSGRENGCLHYVPGSHLWPDLPITGLAGDMDAIEGVLTPEQREQFTPVAIELKAGQASFHHPRMIHGSFENRSDRERRATVINVFRDGVESNSDEPLLAGVPPIACGEKMGGRFFPLLFDPLKESMGLNRTT